MCELRLMRSILERLECSFASQEAKLDRLLTIMTQKPSQQVLQPNFSTPDVHVRQTSFELPFTPAVRSAETAVALPQTSTLADPDWVFDAVFNQSKHDFTGMNNI